MKKMILLLSVNLLLSCSKDKELTDLKTDNTVNATDVVALVDPTENELKQYFDIESTQDIDKAANNITRIKEPKNIKNKDYQ
ncbi:KilA-N domain-containing protein [Flavobacterium columnare]|uniref:KilA-N domain-containing protein n=1 Tax=Flavobacterium columnare TaxID=996 RepID=UPI002989AB02|nr:KilA-N domain-containing protein [Flavobacterium columnare]MCH4828969.1 KilA-N domain-containing protein [Flavobacterium columnare]